MLSIKCPIFWPLETWNFPCSVFLDIWIIGIYICDIFWIGLNYKPKIHLWSICTFTQPENNFLNFNICVHNTFIWHGIFNVWQIWHFYTWEKILWILDHFSFGLFRLGMFNQKHCSLESHDFNHRSQNHWNWVSSSTLQCTWVFTSINFLLIVVLIWLIFHPVKNSC